MRETSSDNVDKDRLCRSVERSDDRNEELGKRWLMFLDSKIDLSDAMKSVVRKQATAANRAKPIGLFFGDNSLVAKQDESIVRAPPEAKRRSFIESFQFYAEERHADSISRAEVIPHVASLLEESALSTPKVASLEQYVERVYRDVSGDRPLDG